VQIFTPQDFGEAKLFQELISLVISPFRILGKSPISSRAGGLTSKYFSMISALMSITGAWVLPDDQLPRRVSTDDMMTEIISGNTAVG
jgi:hypothetical protein